MKVAVDVVRRWYDAFASGDMATVEELLDPSIRFLVPGDNQFSGEYRGRAELMDLWARMKDFTSGTFRVRVHEIIGTHNLAAVLVDAFAERGHESVAETDIEVHRVRDGRIIEISLFIEDVEAGDVFWNA
ncbi:MAG TPA: nuclear transport factor 2 family protein [Actinomycetota bacterium]|jgi:hypothetical protein